MTDPPSQYLRPSTLVASPRARAKQAEKAILTSNINYMDGKCRCAWRSFTAQFPIVPQRNTTHTLRNELKCFAQDVNFDNSSVVK
jgi:hypothetical protein